MTDNPIANIRLALDHFESVRDRLTFAVYDYTNDEGAKGKVTRYHVRPVNPGTSVRYPSFDTKEEADRVAEAYNLRSRKFLADETSHLIAVVRDDAARIS